MSCRDCEYFKWEGRTYWCTLGVTIKNIHHKNECSYESEKEKDGKDYFLHLQKYEEGV